MNTNRPKIKVPYETVDIIVDVLSVTILLVMIVFTIVSYAELPEQIPSHFNGKGEVDGQSDKSIIWLLPTLGTVIFVGLSFLNKFPHAHNYMVNITEDNALKNYRLSTRIVRFTNLFVITIFAFICFMTIQIAKGNNFSLGSWFPILVIGFSIVLPIVIFIYNRKINKS